MNDPSQRSVRYSPCDKDELPNGPVVPSVLQMDSGASSVTVVQPITNTRSSESSSCRAGKHENVMTVREARKARKKDIEHRFGKQRRSHRFERIETSSSSASLRLRKRALCRCTCVFDPSGRLSYWWSIVVSIAFVYNFWIISYRFAFNEITAETLFVWFPLDYTADLVYALDIAFNLRTGFLEEGVLQTESTKLRLHYLNSSTFYLDALCLLPLDFLYLSLGFHSIFRGFRLVKIYRFWGFMDRTERHTNHPNMVRAIGLMHYLLVIFHWNACLINVVTGHFRLSEWHVGQHQPAYLQALHWSTRALSGMCDLPTPRHTADLVFVILETVIGLLLFACILGHVASIVTNLSAARKDFQARLDSVKTYLWLRRVPPSLQQRVIKWFDYLWTSRKRWDEDNALRLLPDKLKAEIALHVHLDTLQRVEIFQNTEAGFLCELVLRLRPLLFSPGDYIVRKGEVGKEMYIVERGRLQVVDDSGSAVLAVLRPGSYFGEISILNMGAAGNRRTASVRSVGYSDLFCLSKTDLWEVLKDYPTVRVRLESIAAKRLDKYKRAPLEQEVLRRSKSAPGLIESKRPAGAGLVPTFTARYHFRPCNNLVLPPGLAGDPSSTSSSRLELRCSGESNPSYVQMLDVAERSTVTVAAVRDPADFSRPTATTTCPFDEFTASENTLSERPASSSETEPTSELGATSQTQLLSVVEYDIRPSSAPASIERDGPEVTQELVIRELARLRQRVQALETENTNLSVRLNQHNWKMETRLEEIEMENQYKESMI